MTRTTTQSPRSGDLRALLSPASVAVVGARDAEGNRGGTAVRLLAKFGFAGAVHPVHPSGEPVAGFRGYRAIADLPDAPDVAILGVGARRVAALLPELADAGVRAAIVWAGGFAEDAGPGVALQDELTAKARDAGIRLLGPNCLGVVNSALGFAGTFASWLAGVDTLLPGRISMVSQSGGLAASAHSWAQAAGTGFHYMISTGNEADIGVVEVLRFLVDDPATAVICCYLEGLADGTGLVGALRAARAAGKPVVVLKGGRSTATAQAVSAHTGALAGEGRIWDAVLAAEGAVQVGSLEELVEVASFLAAERPPAGDRVVVLSHGGGQGIVAADQCHAAGLTVPALSEATRTALAPLVPPIASTRNPVDLTPEAFNRPEFRTVFADALGVLDRSGEADVLLLQFGAMSETAGTELADAVLAARARGSTTFAVHCKNFPATERLRAAGVHVFAEQSLAISALGRVVPVTQDAGAAGARRIADATRRRPPPAGQRVYPEHEVHRMLAEAGLPVPRAEVVNSAADAVGVAGELGYPVALKVVSEAVTHRAAAGLVRLAVSTPDGVRRACDELTARVAELGIEADGVYVQEMVGGGVELLVSAFRDPVFGPVVSCGAGGGLTELLDDIAFATAPLTDPEALRLLGKLRITARSPGLDRTAVAAFLVAFGEFAAGLPHARFMLELNPVSAGPAGVVPLDGLLLAD